MQKAFIVLAGLALLAGSASAQCFYQIEEGDNLYDLAKSWDLNETDLVKLNPQITDPEMIYAGDVLALPCDPSDDATSAGNIYRLLSRRSDLGTLFKALAATGLLNDLKNGDLDATLFAPTDDAFAALLKQLDLSAAALLNDTSLVTDVLSYHIIPDEKLSANKLKNGKSYSTLLKGKKLKIKKVDDKVWVLTVAGQSVPVKVANLWAGDAVVHIIDEVLLPLESEAPTAAPTAAPSPAPTGKCTYTVVAGDTLFDIAAKFKTTLDAVIALNPKIEDPELIQPGDKVKVC